MLESINSPDDIKKLSRKEIKQLAQEMRSTIINVVGKNGGHLASNLGVVELTIALHRVFSSPKDAIIWDVSHQCYPHKLLTGRYKDFSSLRKKDGISGFTNTKESPHDYFINGHSSTSISSALGLLTAWNLNNNDGKVIAVIGDGALTGGMAFEGLCNAAQLSKNLIVILNDNQMSIDHNTGAISRYLSRLSMSHSYQSFRYSIDKTIDRMVEKIPYFGRHVEKFVFRFKRSLKGLILTNNLFTDLGFEYTGPYDGHNEEELEKVLLRVSKLHRPVVVHVVTKKGKGYSPAEDNPELFHGIGPFQISDGKVEKFDNMSFTEAFSNMIVREAENNNKIAAITAAMAKGTGLTSFSHKFPNRFFDVGIAEEHAVTFAEGLSAGGMIPVVCIYSTFLQRAVDQIIHDISLQKLHAIFMVDRAGAVPDDGVTHQGVFDIALLRPVPGLKILSPSTESDMNVCFRYALEGDSAVVIRYPKLSCPPDSTKFEQIIEEGVGVFISQEELLFSQKKSVPVEKKDRILIVSTGGLYTEVKAAAEKCAENNIITDLYMLRFIKPLDEEYFISLAKNYKGVLFAEDGVKTGGVSEYLEELLSKNNCNNTKILAFGDRYYEHGTRAEILEAAGLSVECITAGVQELKK
ncbi:MAG: 1-deoxy-D-xylulose-5-phosphate synthase [Treponema sp.]|nr:1-deoxy-D-xylulose-5-phosphate synthase [Treponema sp.]